MVGVCLRSMIQHGVLGCIVLSASGEVGVVRDEVGLGSGCEGGPVGGEKFPEGFYGFVGWHLLWWTGRRLGTMG